MSTISKSELRKFGLTVGAAFALIGAVSWHRGHPVSASALSILGTFLVIMAVVAPAWLRPVQRLWMAAASVLGQVNARLLLTVLFYFVITPIGFVLRVVRGPLNRSLDHSEGSCWVRREPRPVDRARYERQF
jgi:multisubunit Na+/H+ antiporter MnhG subunit